MLLLLFIIIVILHAVVGGFSLKPDGLGFRPNSGSQGLVTLVTSLNLPGPVSYVNIGDNSSTHLAGLL